MDSKIIMSGEPPQANILIMRNKLFIVIALIALLSGCKKDDFLDWKARNEMILEQVKKDPDFKTSPTGLVYCIREDKFTSEAKPNSGSIVRCDICDGWLINGYKFQRGGLNNPVSELIPGFQEALKMIHTYGTIEIYVPYELGYGKDGIGTEGTTSFIPPYSLLHFYIHIAAIN